MDKQAKEKFLKTGLKSGKLEVSSPV